MSQCVCVCVLGSETINDLRKYVIAELIPLSNFTTPQGIIVFGISDWASINKIIIM